MSRQMQSFFMRQTITYKQDRMLEEPPEAFEEDENASIKRTLAMFIEQKTRDRDGKLESVRRQIEQAELDAIAADFEEEERKKRLAEMGGGSWA